MVLKIATIVCLLALAQSATIQQRNIPVEVKYDEATKITGLEENANADVADSTSDVTQTNAVRNLDEKVQLSPEDLSQASKHLPVVTEITLKNLEDLPRAEEVTPTPASIHSVLQQAEDIIYSGLKRLRNSFKAEKDQKVPNSEQWDDFEKSVNEYLSEEKSKLQVKQDKPPQNQNIFQSIAQGFQNAADNFIQNLVTPSQSSNSNSTSSDEQQGQGPFQGFVSFFQGGVNNVVSTINGLGNQGPTTSNVVLGDTGTATTQAPNLVSNIVSNVQQFFGQIQGAVQGGGSSGTQGDTGVNSTSSGSPQRPGQIIQSIGSAINQFIQGRPPNSSGDEGTGTTEGNVNIIQSIGNVIQNSPLNPFRPTQKPTEGGATTSNPIQAGISGVQNIGSQIQQLIPGQTSSTEAPKAPEKVQAEQVEPSSQAPVETVETSSEAAPAPQQAKSFDLMAVENEQQEEVKKEEEIKEEEVKKEEEIKEEVKKEEEIKEEVKKEEEIKGEEVKQQMEEQVKQEEIKEELKQEELREKIEEKKEEIMMTAE